MLKSGVSYYIYTYGFFSLFKNHLKENQKSLLKKVYTETHAH